VSRSVYVALVRHAPTDWNAEGRAQGRADVPLSAEGRARLAHWHLPPDLVELHRTARLGWAASPLQRAVATAEALGAAGPILEPRLAERDYGAWTGRRLAELDEALATGGWTHRPPGGESPADVLGRVRAWLDEVAASSGPADWVAVTHRGVIRALVAAAVGWNLCAPEPLRLLPERLHRIRRRGDGLLQLITLNEPLIDRDPSPLPLPPGGSVKFTLPPGPPGLPLPRGGLLE
jgi:broad specificity phosphatase PhoE